VAPGLANEPAPTIASTEVAVTRDRIATLTGFVEGEAWAAEPAETADQTSRSTAIAAAGARRFTNPNLEKRRKIRAKCRQENV
jgi:hypothetical protein